MARARPMRNSKRATIGNAPAIVKTATRTPRRMGDRPAAAGEQDKRAWPSTPRGTADVGGASGELHA